MMILTTTRPAENELGHGQFRIEQLEMIVRELLIKNEQLRMALSSQRSVEFADMPQLGLR
jgi:hypothetical protein